MSAAGLARSKAVYRLMAACGGLAIVFLVVWSIPSGPRSVVAKSVSANAQHSSAKPATSGALGTIAEPGTGSQCPVSLAYPRVLPSTVTGWVSRSCDANVAIWTLSLAGTANTDTTVALGAAGGAAHAASVVTYIVSFPSSPGPPGWQSLPDPIVNDATVRISTTVLSDGAVARITTPVTGFGMSRVEWIKDGSYFQVLCPHGATVADGLTGISDSDLLALANSVR
jgi:hypothetical protein